MWSWSRIDAWATSTISGVFVLSLFVWIVQCIILAVLSSTYKSFSKNSRTTGRPGLRNLLHSVCFYGIAVVFKGISLFQACKHGFRALNQTEFNQQARNISPTTCLRLTFSELVRATNAFSDQNEIGRGGSCTVYKGTLGRLPQVVAVKRLKNTSRMKSIQDNEFGTELKIATRIHHRHLTSLVGYCIEGDERILVYNFASNGTLYDALYSDRQGKPRLDWAKRMKIAVGSARALEYLHEGCNPGYIHRDVKPSNILLNEEWEAQVADYGLVKQMTEGSITESNDDLVTDDFMTKLAGTVAYIDPQYRATGRLSVKSDVYSFGVVLLELITGRKPIIQSTSWTLVSWAEPLWTQGSDAILQNFIDGRLILDTTYNENSVLRMAQVAGACLQSSPADRPSMSQVVQALQTDIGDLTELGLLKPRRSNSANSFGDDQIPVVAGPIDVTITGPESFSDYNVSRTSPDKETFFTSTLFQNRHQETSSTSTLVQNRHQQTSFTSTLFQNRHQETPFTKTLYQNRRIHASGFIGTADIVLEELTTSNIQDPTASSHPLPVDSSQIRTQESTSNPGSSFNDHELRLDNSEVLPSTEGASELQDSSLVSELSQHLSSFTGRFTLSSLVRSPQALIKWSSTQSFDFPDSAV